MKLPNGRQAVVEDVKLREYVLSRTHPVGRHHAALFQRLLGIDSENADVLKEALLAAAMSADVLRVVETPYGRKYEMRFELAGPRGTKTVRAAWIINRGGERPRLITCYVE